MFYVNLVIIGKKSLKDMQNVKTDESEDITTKSQITKEDSKRGRKKKKNKTTKQWEINSQNINNLIFLNGQRTLTGTSQKNKFKC